MLNVYKMFALTMNRQGERIGCFSFLILSLASQSHLLLWRQRLQKCRLKELLAFLLSIGSECLVLFWLNNKYLSFPLSIGIRMHFTFSLSPTAECLMLFWLNYIYLSFVDLHFTFSSSPTARSKTARPSSPISPFSLLSPSESETIQVTLIGDMKHIF